MHVITVLIDFLGIHSTELYMCVYMFILALVYTSNHTCATPLYSLLICLSTIFLLLLDDPYLVNIKV